MRLVTTAKRPEPAAGSSERANRYLVAVVVMTVALIVMAVIDDTGGDTVAPFVGAVAIASWYGGIGPGFVSIVAGFAASWLMILSPRGSWRFPDDSDVMRWVTTLAVAVIVLWASWALRRVGKEATVRAETAEHERFMTESVQLLATDLSSAVTQSDVAHTLVERLPGLLGAAGAAVGLIDGGELVIVDPAGASRQTVEPGMRLDLDLLTPLTTAARTGEVAIAATRDAFEDEFPDGAALAAYAMGALAVPLHSGGEVVGSMGFSFAEPDAIEDESVSFVQLAADLGGQALERARLYEQERASREALDRISRLAPRFGAETPESILATVCREAIETFKSEIAQVWAIDGEGFRILWREPESDTLPPGTAVQVSDFPGLAESMQRLETLFIEDSWRDVRGAALAHARAAGVRSSLRVPVAVGGRAERVLVLQWTRVVPEPSTSAIVLARRFADQAGLALAHAELRVAEVAVSRNAEETRRLLGVTAALAAALEPASVAEATLDEAFRGLGAAAGAVVRLSGGSELALVATRGYPDRTVEGWDRFDLDAGWPLSEAVRQNAIVALESPAERARLYPALPPTETHAAWLAVPLVAGGRVVGGLGLSFATARPFTGADREFVLALSRQAGQALERSKLLEDEHAARMRAERMASDLAQLHALATSLGSASRAREVTSIIGDQMVQGMGADGAAVFILSPDRETVSLLSVSGALTMDDLGGDAELSTGDPSPVVDAVRHSRAVWLSGDEPAAAFPVMAASRELGVGSVGIVPLVVEQKAIGALLIVFEGGREPTAEDRRFAETVARQAAQPLERVRLLEEERSSRLRAERATLRIRRLQTVTESLSGALTSNEVVDVFLTQASPAIGVDGVAIRLVGENGAAADEPAWRGDHARVPESWLDAPPQARTPVKDALADCAPLYFDDAASVAGAYPDLEQAPQDDVRSFAFVPLLAGRRLLAATVLTWPSRAFLGSEDRAFVEAFSSQCGQALDRAQRYETERTIAETLQRSVLPETLPSMEGATVAARYLPGTEAIDVGGDWFDTILLPDGRLCFAVGDVVGKGVQAAATMAQLRNGMRALTLDSSDPAAIVGKLNRLLEGFTDAPFATLAFAAVDPTTYETSLISAGHLPPLVLSPGREPELLEGTRGLPLGVDPDTSYEAWTTTFEPGSVLVLYTDGLVERRDRPLDEGLRLLIDAARGVEAGPDELVDLLIERLLGDEARRDDVAVLAVALDRAPLGMFSVRLPSDRDALIQLRRSFAGWLERSGISESDRRDVMLATWEASANAIEHALSPSEPVIEVEATLSGNKVRVEVSDRGQWTEPRERPDRGLGLHLIRSLMTSLTVEQGSGGTRVVMERSLSRERAGERGANGAEHRGT